MCKLLRAHTLLLCLAALAFGVDWKAIMAASCMAVLPPVVLYFIGQRYFIEGIVLSGLKA